MFGLNICSKIFDLVLRRVIGVNGHNSNGSEWKRQRNIVKPVFHGSLLNSYANVFSSISMKLADGISNAGLVAQPLQGLLSC